MFDVSHAEICQNHLSWIREQQASESNDYATLSFVGVGGRYSLERRASLDATII